MQQDIRKTGMYGAVLKTCFQNTSTALEQSCYLEAPVARKKTTKSLGSGLSSTIPHRGRPKIQRPSSSPARSIRQGQGLKLWAFWCRELSS